VCVWLLDLGTDTTRTVLLISAAIAVLTWFIPKKKKVAG
jgi:hypothetical protein